MIFWFSNIYDYKMLSSNKKLSPASSYWQLRLIEALKKNKKKILIYSYYIQDYWPLNDFFINNKCKKSIHYLKFINLPIIKKYYLYNQYKKIFIKFHKKNNIIFTYNFDKIIIKLVNELKKKFNFKWYSIVADFNDKEIDNINKCVKNSFEDPGNQDSYNKILADDSRWAASNNLKFHPSITINNKTYDGNVKGMDLAVAICAAYNEKPDECELSWKIRTY